MKGLGLLAIFIGIPLIEIALFVQIGGRIGLAWTIIIVIATAIAGTILLRSQGLAVMSRAQDTMNAGEMPVESLVDGVFLLIAGILLLTPGFLTDFIGFLFFIPILRQTLGRYLWRRIARSGSVSFRDLRGGGSARGPRDDRTSPHARRSEGLIIEGEIVRESNSTSNDGEAHEDEEPTVLNPPRSDSPWRQ